MEEVRIVLFYEVQGARFACGQTVGADGCGEHVLLLCGEDTQQCQEKCNEIIRSLKERYREVKTRVVINEEGFSGFTVRKILVP